MRSVIDILDLTVEEIDELISTACDIMEHPEAYATAARGKKLATLFYEPSTRTRLSFEAAMYELGGHVIGFSDEKSSSAAKGESVSDTIRMMACYADIVAMRHHKEGAAWVASQTGGIPIINAGDGGHFHPTQTLADLCTIYKEKGHFDNLTVGFCGDLKYGRTVHSLINALSRYENVRVILVSPEELKLPSYIKQTALKDKHRSYLQKTDLEEVLPELDVLYMTRIQRERFDNPAAYERLKSTYELNAAKLANAKSDLCIMHPLPRVDEISTDVDTDPRACYFKQALYGKFMREALILKLLEEAKDPSVKPGRDFGDVLVNEKRCKNPRCITAAEPLDHLFWLADPTNRTWRCVYCESKEE